MREDGITKVCESNFKSCPCRVLENNKVYCNFVLKFGTLLLDNYDNKAKQFLQKICPEKRNSVLSHDYRAEILQRLAEVFLNEANIGDIVFCTAEINDVMLVEKPSTIYGDCKYKTVNEKLKKAPAFCFSIISNGNKYAEYEINTKTTADHYKYLARRNGYRADVIKLKHSYLLKIFGDKQEEVDDFINLCCKNDYIIDY